MRTLRSRRTSPVSPPPQRSVLCHAGTGTEVVRSVLRDLGGGLVVVNDPDLAYDLDMDAVILLGGADINTRLYGERSLHAQLANRSRDMVEWTLVRRALSEGKPIMGICRGMQMLAAAAGGSLYQDIAAQHGSDHDHQGRSHELVNVLEPLASRLPATRVNSLHHQAVRTVPYGWEILATAPDGVIESIWRPGALGVQWHPELLIGAGDTRWVSLFQWFMDGLS